MFKLEIKIFWFFYNILIYIYNTPAISDNNNNHFSIITLLLTLIDHEVVIYLNNSVDAKQSRLHPWAAADAVGDRAHRFDKTSQTFRHLSKAARHTTLYSRRSPKLVLRRHVENCFHARANILIYMLVAFTLILSAHSAFVNAVHQTERKHMVLFLMRIMLSTDIQHCLIVPNESLTSSSSNTIPKPLCDYKSTRNSLIYPSYVSSSLQFSTRMISLGSEDN